MDPSLLSGTFGFYNIGAATTYILPMSENPVYPYEPAQMNRRNQGRTDSGAHYCYTRWDKKHRFPLHFRNEARETTEILGSLFNEAGTFLFNPSVGESIYYTVRCVDEEWHPVETFRDLFSFEVVLEEV